MLKLIGVSLIFASGLALRRELSSVRRGRLALCEEMMRFIAHIRVEIGCYLRPISELGSGFDSHILSSSGFLSAVGERGILGAYVDALPKLRLTAEEKEVLYSLFSRLGSGYLADELKLIDEKGAEFSRLLEIERASCPREVRLISTLSSAASLGLIIFLL